MRKKGEAVQVKQIAEKLKLSSSTVSVVLNGKGDAMRISKSTQAMIRNAAKEMNYQPVAGIRRTGNLHPPGARIVIAIFLNTKTTGDRMAQIMSGLWKEKKKNICEIEYVLEFFEQAKLFEQEKLLCSAACQGILVVGVSEKDIDYLNHRNFQIPLAVMNVPGEGFSSVYLDEYRVGRECAILFARARMRTAGVFTKADKGRSTGMRQLGFIQTCREYGIKVRDGWVIETEERSAEAGKLAMEQLLRQEEIPQAVFLMSDSLAIGAAYTAMQRGIEVPERMRLICYGDNELLPMLEPSISSISFSVEEMAEEAAGILLSQIENSSTEPIVKIKTADFIFRDSFPEPV